MVFSFILIFSYRCLHVSAMVNGSEIYEHQCKQINFIQTQVRMVSTPTPLLVTRAPQAGQNTPVAQ